LLGRFGLEHGGEERTQREIAKQLGISRSYVSRIEKRALMKLYREFYKAKRYGAKIELDRSATLP
jgi:RNA polymerase sporulation-specific sigma factor